MSSQSTEVVDWIGQQSVGYMVNAAFSDETRDDLARIGQQFAAQFPGGVFIPPAEALHTTLLDLVAPLNDYGGGDKQALYEQVRASYEREIRRIIMGKGVIRVHFDELCVSPTTLFIRGHDNGQFQAIRDEFVASTTALAGAKAPPTIIHSSLGRFVRKLPLADVENFAANIPVDFIEEIEQFRLVHSSREPMLEFEELTTYPLR